MQREQRCSRAPRAWGLPCLLYTSRDAAGAARAGASAVAVASALHYGGKTVPQRKQEARDGGVEVRNV